MYHIEAEVPDDIDRESSDRVFIVILQEMGRIYILGQSNSNLMILECVANEVPNRRCLNAEFICTPQFIQTHGSLIVSILYKFHFLPTDNLSRDPP